MNRTHPKYEHEQYEELCAPATAEALTPLETEELKAHLDECAECRVIFAQYETLASEAMPSLGIGYSLKPDAAEAPFDEDSSLARLLDTVATRKDRPGLRLVPTQRPALRAMVERCAGSLTSYRSRFRFVSDSGAQERSRFCRTGCRPKHNKHNRDHIPAEP